MGLSVEADADLEEKHTELCNKLNLDYKVLNDAWECFQSISKNYTLEGDPLHWIGCTVYAACWKHSCATSENSIQGNCVPLTNLLRHCNLSIAQFFFKMKQLCDMASLPNDFRQRVEYLEESFAVAYNVFKEYQPTFLKIFKAPELSEAELKQSRTRKMKSSLCTPLKLFEFCWTLFITMKNEDTNYNNELVPSYNLLIAICDWAFKNAFMANRRDLLNPDFKGLPLDWTNPDYVAPSEVPCIVSFLCPSDNTITDVKYIKEYRFKASVTNLFNLGVLTGANGDNDVFDSSIFEQNFTNLSENYESNFLSKCDLDERIFIAEFRRKLLLEENQNHGDSSVEHNAVGAASPEPSREMVAPQECLTPLTGRKYLGPRESQDSAHSLTATESISKLNSLIHGREAAPSDSLVQLFELCAHNPTEKIAAIVARLGDRYINACPVEQREVATGRLQLAITLFYKFLENILQNERTMQSDISAIVEKDVFYECMFACCLEIVIYAYKSHQKFPWILDALQIQSYNFVKVIELIIRSKDKLSRDTIKHLNMIEESILSSLLWKSDSLVWSAILSSEKEVPKFEETALPGHLQSESNTEGSTLRNILNSDSRQIQSPGPSAVDRFQSPVTQNSVINRELFPSVQSTQSLLQHTHLMIKDSTGNTRMIPIVNNEAQKAQPKAPVTPQKRTENPPGRPKRTGAVSILFRKFYNLSGERMEHLCTHLKITNMDTKRKIWTVFEELVRKNNCELLKDRNLDQLLMCAVYMICKLTKLDKNFAAIIKSYRSQPQSNSDIYRKVLIKGKRTEIQDDVVIEKPEERGDLINFYNNVIIKEMKRFVQRFHDRGDDHRGDVPLSPLPSSRGQVVQVLDNIFVKPLESPTMPFATGKVLNYFFSRSPSKDLKDINKAIKCNGVMGKRLLVEGENELPNAKRLSNRKVQNLLEERRNQNTD